MLRFRLRTLLIVLAILPPLLAVSWWTYESWKAEQERQTQVGIWAGGVGSTVGWTFLPSPPNLSLATPPGSELPTDAAPVTVPDEPRE